MQFLSSSGCPNPPNLLYENFSRNWHMASHLNVAFLNEPQSFALMCKIGKPATWSCMWLTNSVSLQHAFYHYSFNLNRKQSTSRCFSLNFLNFFLFPYSHVTLFAHVFLPLNTCVLYSPNKHPSGFVVVPSIHSKRLNDFFPDFSFIMWKNTFVNILHFLGILHAITIERNFVFSARERLEGVESEENA